MSRSDDLFDLVDACDLRVPDKRTIDERPDLLELYTRRPVKIKPRRITSDWLVPVAFVLAFGTII
ncbi:hypothetical protein QP277_26145, partial [Escherichia coli]|nr:hypothetical protein [Escherichia coli]